MIDTPNPVSATEQHNLHSSIYPPLHLLPYTYDTLHLLPYPDFTLRWYCSTTPAPPQKAGSMSDKIRGRPPKQ